MLDKMVRKHKRNRDDKMEKITKTDQEDVGEKEHSFCVCSWHSVSDFHISV